MNLSAVMRAAAILALPALAQAVDFATQVHPILASRCAPCHSGDKPAAGLSLTSRRQALAGGASGPALAPGDCQGSLLIRKVSGQRGAIMPASGEPLTAAQISTLRAWIDEGAPWPEIAPTPQGWVAPIAPRQPDLPAGAEPHPIDRFLAAYFAAHAMPFPGRSAMRDSRGASISICGVCLPRRRNWNLSSAIRAAIEAMPTARG